MVSAVKHSAPKYPDSLATYIKEIIFLQPPLLSPARQKVQSPPYHAREAMAACLNRKLGRQNGAAFRLRRV